MEVRTDENYCLWSEWTVWHTNSQRQAAQALEASHLDWTIVCPPMTIESGERARNYRVQADFLIGGNGRITYEDTAHFILDELEKGQYIHHRVNIAY